MKFSSWVRKTTVEIEKFLEKDSVDIQKHERASMQETTM